MILPGDFQRRLTSGNINKSIIITGSGVFDFYSPEPVFICTDREHVRVNARYVNKKYNRKINQS